MLTQEQKNYLSKMKQATETEKPAGFDLRNRITDKHGEVIEKQDYFIHSKGAQQFFERPPGSGNLFYISGEPAGRLELGEGGQKVILEGEPHQEFEVPLDADGELFEMLQAKTRQLESVKRELDAIRKDKSISEQEKKIRAQGTAQRLEAEAQKERRREDQT